MRPTVIDERDIPAEGRRVVIGPPDGDITGPIRPVEAIVLHQEQGISVFCMKIALDPGDIQKLAEKNHFWISIMGAQLQPFDVFID